jgi:hypothetical protein
MKIIFISRYKLKELYTLLKTEKEIIGFIGDYTGDFQGTKKVERQAGERDFETKSDQETSCKMKVSRVFRKRGGRMLSVCIVISLEMGVERRICVVNCSVRITIYIKGEKNKLCKFDNVKNF